MNDNDQVVTIVEILKDNEIKYVHGSYASVGKKMNELDGMEE